MGGLPLLWEETAVGELMVECQALYDWFTACCHLSGEPMRCAWLVGERGELRLGILEPSRGGTTIRRRLSHRETEGLGKLLRGEVRLAEERWEKAEALSPWLRERLEGAEGLLTRTEGRTRYLAVPYDPRRLFYLTELFCFARVRPIRESVYAVFAFDLEGRPVFVGEDL